jgi:hypothetical protein
VAPVNPPAQLQAGSYSARVDRLGLAGMLTPHASVGSLKGRSGVRPNGAGTSLKVTQRATPAMWVTVGDGTCFVPATSVTGGNYECHNDAPYDVQIAAAHATLARKDLIVGRVYDAIDDVGAQNLFAIEPITGTPAASPARPATPSQAIALAEVTVGANVTSITTANILDLRQQTVSLGGVLPCASAAEVPTSPFPGMKIYRTDLNQEQIWDGTAWRPIAYGAWSTYTPTLTATGTNPTMGTGSSRTGKYFVIGKMVHVNSVVVFGSSGAAPGSGTYRISLPITAATLSIGNYVGAVNALDDSANNGEDGVCRCGPASSGYDKVELFLAGDLVTNAVPWIWANNDAIYFSLTYEAA